MCVWCGAALHTLKLHNTLLGDSGLDSLCNSLADNTSLTHLDLRSGADHARSFRGGGAASRGGEGVVAGAGGVGADSLASVGGSEGSRSGILSPSTASFGALGPQFFAKSVDGDQDTGHSDGGPGAGCAAEGAEGDPTGRDKDAGGRLSAGGAHSLPSPHVAHGGGGKESKDLAAVSSPTETGESGAAGAGAGAGAGAAAVAEEDSEGTETEGTRADGSAAAAAKAVPAPLTRKTSRHRQSNRETAIVTERAVLGASHKCVVGSAHENFLKSPSQVC